MVPLSNRLKSNSVLLVHELHIEFSLAKIIVESSLPKGVMLVFRESFIDRLSFGVLMLNFAELMENYRLFSRLEDVAHLLNILSCPLLLHFF